MELLQNPRCVLAAIAGDLYDNCFRSFRRSVYLGLRRLARGKMKIVCDSCSTKYSISDDKVRGKVFKIRCKKCSHIIVVRGTGEGAPAAAKRRPMRFGTWWSTAIRSDRLSDAEVRARLSRGEISAENYIWKEGFADWLRLMDVTEFADVAGAGSATPGGDLFADPAPISTVAPVASAASGRSSGRHAAVVEQEAFFAAEVPVRAARTRVARRGRPGACAPSRRRLPRVRKKMRSRRRSRRPAGRRQGICSGWRPRWRPPGRLGPGEVPWRERLGRRSARWRSRREPDRAAKREFGAVLAVQPAIARSAGGDGRSTTAPTTRARVSSTSAPWRRRR